MTSRQFAREMGRVLLTLALAAAGGALFRLAGLPAAWLTGSMIAVSVAALAGAPLAVPGWLSAACFLLLGARIGASLDSNMLAHLGKWPGSLLALVLSIPAIIASGSVFLRRVAGWDAPTAYMASIPGALSYVIAMAVQTKADVRLVMTAQMLRLLILMAVLPPLVVALNGYAPSPPPAVPAPEAVAFAGAPGLIILLLASAAGGLALQALRVPAGSLIGSMSVSGALHGGGLVSGQLPVWLVTASLAVLGAYAGFRFKGAELRAIMRSLLPSLGAFCFTLIVAGLFAAAVSHGLGLPLGQTLIAFAPGGLDAMMILAFLLGLDTAYVGAHQFVRFLGIALLLPLIAWPHLERHERMDTDAGGQ
jgi:membrane AbrB-like protein